MIQLPEKCVPFVKGLQVEGECEYFALGRGRRFQVVCLCRRGMHGPVDETGRPFTFVSRRAAQPLVEVLNASLRGQAGCSQQARLLAE
jgi:hypothetical protein